MIELQLELATRLSIILQVREFSRSQSQDMPQTIIDEYERRLTERIKEPIRKQWKMPNNV